MEVSEKFSFELQLPRTARLVNRIDYLAGLCKKKRVLDLGCAASFGVAQPGASRTRSHIQEALFLHDHLKNVADEVIGADLDLTAVEYMRSAGYQNIVVADAENPETLYPFGQFDVIVAGDLIEHLANPGNFLSRVKPLLAPSGCLVITTPNGLAWYYGAFSFWFKEFNHPDHILMFTPSSLVGLFKRFSYEIIELNTSKHRQVFAIHPNDRLTRRILKWVLVLIDRVVAGFCTQFPFSADTLIVVARLP